MSKEVKKPKISMSGDFAFIDGDPYMKMSRLNAGGIAMLKLVNYVSAIDITRSRPSIVKL